MTEEESKINLAFFVNYVWLVFLGSARMEFEFLLQSLFCEALKLLKKFGESDAEFFVFSQVDSGKLYQRFFGCLKVSQTNAAKGVHIESLWVARVILKGYVTERDSILKNVTLNHHPDYTDQQIRRVVK